MTYLLTIRATNLRRVAAAGAPPHVIGGMFGIAAAQVLRIIGGALA